MERKKKKIIAIMAFSASALLSLAVFYFAKSNPQALGFAIEQEQENTFTFNKNAVVTATGFEVITKKGNTFAINAEGVSKSGDGLSFIEGGRIYNSISEVKALVSIVFDVQNGANLLLKVGTNPNHLDVEYTVEESKTIEFDEEMSYFSITAVGASNVTSIKFNYDCTEVTDRTVHAGRGRYTTVINEDIVEMYDTCVCGNTVGEPVATMPYSSPAEFTLEGRSSNNWTKDDETGVWTSGNKGINSSSSYLDLTITKAGLLYFEYTSSGEGGYDYMYFGPSTTESQAYVNCKGSGTSEYNYSGVFKRVMEVGETITFVYKKDSSGNAGNDCGTVRFSESELEYAALSFETNGGTTVAPSFIEDGSIVGDLPTTTFAGKYFEYWCLDSELTEQYTNQKFEGDSVLYAKWVDAVQVTLHSAGSEDQVLDVKPGTTPTLPTPTREGYKFQGWFEDEGFETEYTPSTLNEDIELYAKWFDLSQAHPLYGTYEGIYYSGTSDASNGQSNMFVVEADGSFSLRVYWSSYTNGKILSYNTETGAFTTDTLGSGIFDSTRGTIVFADKAEYSSSTKIYVGSRNTTTVAKGTFGYVNFEKAGSTTTNYLVMAEIKFGSEDIGLLMDYSNSSFMYDVEFKTPNGNDFTIKDTKTTVAAFNVVKNSAVVASYYAASTSGTSSISSYKSTAADSLAGEYTNANGKTLYVSGNGVITSPLYAANGCAKYEVLDEENGIIGTSYSSTIRHIITLDKVNHTYTYENRTVDVTFDLNYEGAPASTTVAATYDCIFNLDKNGGSPTREGYEFKGWGKDPNDMGTQVNLLSDDLKSDITVYAKWAARVEVKFVEADGVTPVEGTETRTVTTGDNVGQLPTPTKEGYDFDGWYTDTTFETPVTSYTKVGGPMLIYAHWTLPVTCTLHNYNGTSEETDIETISLQVNRVATLPTPTAEGKAFLGWYTDASYETPYDTNSVVTADLDLYAKWMNAHSMYGTFKAFNIYGSGDSTVGINATSFSVTYTVDADGTFKKNGSPCGTLSAESGVVSTTSLYVYFNPTLNAFWAPYGSNSSSVGTDTYLAIRNIEAVEKVNVLKYATAISGSPYTFIFEIVYKNGTAVVGAAYNNVLYDNVTFSTEMTFTQRKVSQAVTVYDKEGNEIFSK